MENQSIIKNLYQNYRIKVYGKGFNTLVGMPKLSQLLGEQGLLHLLFMQAKRESRGNQKETYKFRGYQITFYIR